MFAYVCDSAVARTLDDISKPVYHTYAGLFAGLFRRLDLMPACRYQC